MAESASGPVSVNCQLQKRNTKSVVICCENTNVIHLLDARAESQMWKKRSLKLQKDMLTGPNPFGFCWRLWFLDLFLEAQDVLYSKFSNTIVHMNTYDLVEYITCIYCRCFFFMHLQFEGDIRLAGWLCYDNVNGCSRVVQFFCSRARNGAQVEMISTMNLWRIRWIEGFQRFQGTIPTRSPGSPAKMMNQIISIIKFLGTGQEQSGNQLLRYKWFHDLPVYCVSFVSEIGLVLMAPC